ncbi:hypothetical protein EAG_14901 [Camponotus floridanus]|uniref:Uncharacterized protein n=1 Tax=Camponotus floridanus TaxID=104421 RepID=E2B0X5_CAMFO|nr:hypothetical protein EAG_14901 [Camponotus floridanus]
MSRGRLTRGEHLPEESGVSVTRVTSRQVSSPTPPRSVPAAGEQSAFDIGLPSTNGMRGAGRYLNNLTAHLRRAHRLIHRVNGRQTIGSNSDVTPIVSPAVYQLVQQCLIAMWKNDTIRLICLQNVPPAVSIITGRLR